MNTADLNIQPFQHIASTSLPIYQTCTGETGLVYTPGLIWIMTKTELREVIGDFQQKHINPQAAAVVEKAKDVVQIHQSMRKADFQPTNITLYLNQKCNFECQYCFAIEKPNRSEELSLDACRAGLDLVGENCRQLNAPMTLAIHGGGEPILSFQKIQRILEHVQAVAEKKGIKIYKYIATNGVMPTEKARWVACHFDRVGISCDGPPEIQDKQRHYSNHSTSNQLIEQTAKIIREHGKALDVRVTITPATVDQQPMIARYICENISPQEIHVEPVYLGKHTSIEDCISPARVDDFISFFLAAEETARQFGTAWKMSGARLNEVHSSYCHLWQQVLNLVPGDHATACFKLVNDREVLAKGFSLGRYEKGRNIFVIDQANFHRLMTGMQTPDQCQGCFIQYQCSHACPNNCLLTHEFYDQSLCLILKELALRQIFKASEKLKAGEMTFLENPMIY
jgi:sulfatase maturation enzyme AslB (radical SAM superfamily)